MKSQMFAVCLFVLALAVCPVAHAQTYTDLFDFDGTSHGCCSSTPGVLAQGRDGNLYGSLIDILNRG